MTGNPPIARLTRAELLREIGLSPLWQLRPQPTVAVTRHVTPARPARRIDSRGARGSCTPTPVHSCCSAGGGQTSGDCPYGLG
jgi:hypothetical protein